MKYKKRYYLAAAVVATGVAVTALYYWWTAPYKLPEVSGDISISEYGLVFDKEIRAQREIDSMPAINKAELLKLAIGREPDNLAYSNELRLLMRDGGRTNDYLSFLEELQTESREIKLQRALAYVDQLQDPDLGTASLGQLSTRSISLLNDVVDKAPYDWFAHYARGLNNLYWPSGLQRTDKAIQDLGYCLAVSKQLETSIDLPLWPLIYEAYGDALVKNGQEKEGIAVWKEGSRKYPGAATLQRRAMMTEEEAHNEVRTVRGIDEFRRPDPGISDLSLVWKSAE